MNVVHCHLTHPIVVVVIVLLLASLNVILGYLYLQLLATALRKRLLGHLLLDHLNVTRRSRDTTTVDFKVFYLDPIQLLIQIFF